MRTGVFALVILVFGATFARAELKLVKGWPSGANACIDAPLRLTFDRAPLPGAGKIEVFRATDSAPVASVDAASSDVRIDGTTATVRLPRAALAYGESYLVRVKPGAFVDFSGVSDGGTFQTKAPLPRNPDRLVVAMDGGGDFCTVQGAVDHVQPHRERPVEIFVRKGVYRELVRVGRERTHIRLVGEDRADTVISATNNDRLNPGWIQRAVLGVEGDDFTLENLTVENTTPYKGSQAEAVYVNADRCTLRGANFRSFQDTLNLSGRVYVVDCAIEGDVDFVWGYGTACFDRCELRVMHDGYIVQARNPAGRAGYVFLDCRITAAPGVKKCWLARIGADRFPASHVAFVRCKIGVPVPPLGWLVTGGPSNDLRFEEFGNVDLSGYSLDVSGRSPVAKILTTGQAEQLTPSLVLTGWDGWDRAAGGKPARGEK